MCNSFSARIDFIIRRQNLTSIDVRFCLLKSILAMRGFRIETYIYIYIYIIYICLFSAQLCVPLNVVTTQIAVIWQYVTSRVNIVTSPCSHVDHVINVDLGTHARTNVNVSESYYKCKLKFFSLCKFYCTQSDL